MLGSLNPQTVTELNSRCDRCPGSAKVVVTLPSGFELRFCQHHADQAALPATATVTPV